MAVRQILSTDTLESGLRVKYNETVNEIIESASLSDTGILTLNKVGGGTIEVDLTDQFYTKDQVIEALESGASVPLATEEIAGRIRIATNEEAISGEEESAAITPYTLAAVLANLISGSAQKTTITLTSVQLNSTGGDIVVNGVTLSASDGVIVITYDENLLIKHGNNPLLSCWFDKQSQPVIGMFDDQANPTTLTIDTGAQPATDLILSFI